VLLFYLVSYQEPYLLWWKIEAREKDKIQYDSSQISFLLVSVDSENFFYAGKIKTITLISTVYYAALFQFSPPQNES